MDRKVREAVGSGQLYSRLVQDGWPRGINFRGQIHSVNSLTVIGHDILTRRVFKHGPADSIHKESITNDWIRCGVAWLKSHQRESGRWFTPSQGWHTQHRIANAGTAFAVLALHACGEIPKPSEK